MTLFIYLLNGLGGAIYFTATTILVLFPLIKYTKKEKIIERLFLVGFLIQTISIGAMIFERGFFPAINLTEVLFLISWITFGILFIINALYKPRIARLFILPIVFIMYLISCENGIKIIPKDSLFTHPLFPVHVFFSIIGEATFLIAFLLGIFFFIESYSLKRKKFIPIFGYLPSLEAIEEAMKRLLDVGFLCISVGLTTGIIWLKIDQDLWFDTKNPKLILATISWCFYGCILLYHYLLNLRGKRIAYTAVFGFILIIGTFFGALFNHNWHSF